MSESTPRPTAHQAPSSLPPDTEPGPDPTLPGTDLWGDSDTEQMPLRAELPAEPQPAAAAQATIGHIGRYALKNRIGEGGLGTVWAAQDPLLSRVIAIKTLTLNLHGEEREAFNAMFLNEARASGGLSHPNIVTVYDAGISGDRAYIAMELLKGRDLRQLRQEGWRPTPLQAALIVRRVADALAYAHSKGVVHCDIKPANIFMVGRTQPRVLDFGIARIAHRRDTGAPVGGSPHYMAPEQVRRQPIDRRADVFSLGAVLFELLTDRKAFRGNSLEEITAAVLEHEPPLASTIDPKVPRALAEITARALHKDPEQRYRSARHFSRDLRHWLEERALEGDAMEPPAPKPSRAVWAWLGGTIAAAALVAVAWQAAPPREPVLAAPAAAPVVQAAPSPAAVPADTAPAVAAAASAVDPVAAQAPAVAETPAPQAPAAAAPPPAATPEVVAPPAAPVRSAARERRTRDAAAPTPAAAPAAFGVVNIAVSPWGQIEVDGTPVGTAPPLTELNLPAGRHQITVRNTDLPPHTVTVEVSASQPVTVRHRF